MSWLDFLIEYGHLIFFILITIYWVTPFIIELLQETKARTKGTKDE